MTCGWVWVYSKVLVRIRRSVTLPCAPVRIPPFLTAVPSSPGPDAPVKHPALGNMATPPRPRGAPNPTQQRLLLIQYQRGVQRTHPSTLARTQHGHPGLSTTCQPQQPQPSCSGKTPTSGGTTHGTPLLTRMHAPSMGTPGSSGSALHSIKQRLPSNLTHSVGSLIHPSPHARTQHGHPGVQRLRHAFQPTTSTLKGKFIHNLERPTHPPSMGTPGSSGSALKPTTPRSPTGMPSSGQGRSKPRRTAWRS